MGPTSTSDRSRQWWESKNLRSSGSPEDKTTVQSCALVERQTDVTLLLRLMVHVSTLMRLGIVNVARVVVYRACKRFGIYSWLLPPLARAPLELDVLSSDDISQPAVPWADSSVITEANELLIGKVNYFSVHPHDVGNPPDWFLNPFQNKRHPQPTAHWSKIADFNADAGDIKIIWELSRFTWAPVLARAWRISGNPHYLSALQLWLQDWWRCNPPNTGPNWMCGQETAIRLTNALFALRIAGLEKNVRPGLVTFVQTHCRRIELTTLYAIAQDNNHAISEATGLFVGGTWLAKYGEGEAKARGRQWGAEGRRLLERSVSRLISPDGSFSQHSLTYHRMMLDTLSVAEAWRRTVEVASFTEGFYSRAAAATMWLSAMIDLQRGDGPNLGANDGTLPYRLDTCAYRDFRPCLQLASMLFSSGPALEAGPWNESAAWLGISREGFLRRDVGRVSAVFSDGGYVVMRNGAGAHAILRTPTARFRPAHADALHLDLRWKEQNLLRDGGTYSYAHGTLAKVLSSVVGHNVCEFDGHDQMLLLSRFLYGGWVRVVGESTISGAADRQTWSGSYTDIWGARHKRSVCLRTDTLTVRDEVQGFRDRAVLRWHLAPANWTQNEAGCASSMGRIVVESSVGIRRLSLKEGWESRHYLEKSEAPVLEVEVGRSPAVLVTTVTLS